jgi:hypothetical protein
MEKITMTHSIFSLLLSVFVSVTTTNSQPITFQKTFGGSDYDYGYSVQQTSDGGYIIAGFTSSFGANNGDVYIVKTDANGDTLFTKTFGGSSYYYGPSVQQTSDGGYIIAGTTQSYSDVYLIKTDANGNTFFTKTFGGSNSDWGSSVQQTSDGGYIIAGFTNSFGAGEEDVYLIKTDANGDTLFTKTFGGGRNDEGFSVQQTSDGGYIIAGFTWSFHAGNFDVYLIKTDANGDTLFTKTFGGTSNDYGYSVQQTSDGGYIIAGSNLIKTDANGNTLFTKTLSGNSVQQTSDGGYIIAGSTYSFGTGSKDVYLVKTDANGNTLFTKTFGGSSDDAGESVQQTSDGGYIIAGWTYSFGAGSKDVYLIKTDSNGNFVNNKYRTFKPSDGMTDAPVKLQYKKNTSTLKKTPNEATALEAEFKKIGKNTFYALGIPQTVKDSIKKYAWVDFKNDKGKAASTIKKLFTSTHTGKAYPLDSLRKNGKAKKIKGVVIPNVKNYNNVAIEQGVLFKLNIQASKDGILPYGFGELLFNKPITIIGRQLQGLSLQQIGNVMDSMMTYYQSFGITDSAGYAQLALLVDSVLRPINETFTANIDSTNFEITSIDFKKNPYGIKLLGVKTAEESNLVVQVVKQTPPQFETTELQNAPAAFSLLQNYPNPFNPVTAISFQLSAFSNVTLKVYNVLGQEVATLIHSREMDEGMHEVTFDANGLTSGVYFYRLTTDNYSQIHKMILLK